MGWTAQPIGGRFPDYQSVHGSNEWRSSMEEPTGLAIAPRGRKGLWDAMARAAVGRRETRTAVAAALAIDPAPTVDPGIEVVEDAHLAYLARLSGTGGHGGAEVIDLDAYRARRR